MSPKASENASMSIIMFFFQFIENLTYDLRVVRRIAITIKMKTFFIPVQR
jgi:hypothetical protein